MTNPSPSSLVSPPAPAVQHTGVFSSNRYRVLFISSPPYLPRMYAAHMLPPPPLRLADLPLPLRLERGPRFGVFFCLSFSSWCVRAGG